MPEVVPPLRSASVQLVAGLLAEPPLLVGDCATHPCGKICRKRRRRRRKSAEKFDFKPLDISKSQINRHHEHSPLFSFVKKTTKQKGRRVTESNVSKGTGNRCRYGLERSSAIKTGGRTFDVQVMSRSLVRRTAPRLAAVQLDVSVVLRTTIGSTHEVVFGS